MAKKAVPRAMEPRATSPASVVGPLQALHDAGIPNDHCWSRPLIPGLMTVRLNAYLKLQGRGQLNQAGYG